VNYNQQEHNEEKNKVEEPTQDYAAREALEEARLKEVLLMSDMEKFKLFCRMMRIGKMLASAKVTHQRG
jgi:hypothetical protein